MSDGKGQMPRMRLRSRRGQVVVEQALLLPAAMIALIAALGIMLLLLRGVIVHAGAGRAERSLATFDEESAQRELLASLPPQLFAGGAASGRTEQLQNNEGGAQRVNAVGNGALVPKGGAVVAREAPSVPALVPGLSDEVLRGGDAPSVYCRSGRSYRVCGFDE